MMVTVAFPAWKWGAMRFWKRGMRAQGVERSRLSTNGNLAHFNIIGSGRKRETALQPRFQ
jgi:hypothetical protein